MNQIEQFLKEISLKYKKDFNQNFTDVLKKIELFVFDPNVVMSEDDISLLFYGDYENFTKGLFHLCGNRKMITNKLKGSSFNSLELLNKFFMKSNQKELFIQVFCDTDEDMFVNLQLGNHVLSNKTTEIALNLARMIYEKRPHLNLDMYLQNEKSKEFFNQWYKQNKTNFPKNETTNNTVQFEQKNDIPNVRQSIQNDVRKNVKKKHDIGKMFEMVINRDINYYEQTLEDPIQMVLDEQDQKKKSKSNKNFLFKTKLIRTILPEGIHPQEKELLYDKIHIDSPNFDASKLLNTFHKHTSKDDLQIASQRLQKQIKQQIEINKNLIYFFINDYFTVEKQIKDIRQNFILVEIKNGISQSIKQETQSLKLKLGIIYVHLFDVILQKLQIKKIILKLHKKNYFIKIIQILKIKKIKLIFKNLIEFLQHITQFRLIQKNTVN